MTKKLRFFSFITAALLLFTSCSTTRKSPYDGPFVEAMVDVAGYISDVGDLENSSTNIVQGKLLDDAEQKNFVDGNGDIYHGGTISTLTITKVISGNLKAGDEIKVGEPYYYDDGYREPHTLVYTINYFPSDVGKEYLFFLCGPNVDGPWKGIYGVNSYSYGRYPMLNPNARDAKSIDDMTREELNLAKDDAHYKELYKEAISKYMSE